MNLTVDTENLFDSNYTNLSNTSDFKTDNGASSFKPEYLAIPMLILSLIFTIFQHAYHNSLSSREKNIVVFIDIGIAYYTQAANIIFLCPVIWRSFVSVIPVNLAVVIDMCGRCCIFNFFLNYSFVSIMKILLYHEVSFSMTTDQKKLSKGIFCFSFFWWLGVNFRMFATKRHRLFGYFQYLTKEELVTGPVNLGGTALLIMNTIFMIMVEIYLMVSLKRWPSLFHQGKLKSVFVAILSMIVSIIIHTTTLQFPEFNSIRISCASFSFQFLYMVKIHFFVIKQIKKFWNIFVSVVTGKGLPELDDEEQGNANYNSSSFPVNSYGIFVGRKPKPQTITNVGSNIANKSFSTVHHLIDEVKERKGNKCRRIYVIPLDKNKSSVGEIINEEIIGEDGEISMKAEFSEKEIDNKY